MKLYKIVVMIPIIFFLQVAASRPLKILFVVEYFPAPAQTHVLNIITGLLDKDHEISIFAYQRKSISGQYIQPAIEKYSLMDSVIYEKLPEKLPEYDIIFCQSATLAQKMLEDSRLIHWLKNRKLVVALRGHDITKNEIKDDPTLYALLFKHADLFLPVCDYFKKIAIERGCDPQKIIVHHSAIDCTQFFFRERKPKKSKTIRLVSVCRLVEKKGLYFAIEAIAQVCKKYKNVHFTIVGTGRLKASLKALVKTLGIKNKVTFFGWATPRQIIDILNISDIFLLPSITASNGDEEGIANALKEAMAMGVISIGTLHAGTAELIEDRVSGFLVPEKNSEQLAIKIKYIIAHPEIWTSMRRAARKKIEKEFETKKSITQLEKIFYGLLA